MYKLSLRLIHDKFNMQLAPSAQPRYNLKLPKEFKAQFQQPYEPFLKNLLKLTKYIEHAEFHVAVEEGFRNSPKGVKAWTVWLSPELRIEFLNAKKSMQSATHCQFINILLAIHRRVNCQPDPVVSPNDTLAICCESAESLPSTLHWSLDLLSPNRTLSRSSSANSVAIANLTNDADYPVKPNISRGNSTKRMPPSTERVLPLPNPKKGKVFFRNDFHISPLRYEGSSQHSSIDYDIEALEPDGDPFLISLALSKLNTS
jgi:hypothetical protein